MAPDCARHARELLGTPAIRGLAIREPAAAWPPAGPGPAQTGAPARVSVRPCRGSGCKVFYTPPSRTPLRGISRPTRGLRGVLHPAFPHASAGHLASYARLARCSTPRWLHVHGTARHGTACTARHGTARQARPERRAWPPCSEISAPAQPCVYISVHTREHASRCTLEHQKGTAPTGGRTSAFSAEASPRTRGRRRSAPSRSVDTAVTAPCRSSDDSAATQRPDRR